MLCRKEDRKMLVAFVCARCNDARDLEPVNVESGFQAQAYMLIYGTITGKRSGVDFRSLLATLFAMGARVGCSWAHAHSPVLARSVVRTSTAPHGKRRNRCFCPYLVRSSFVASCASLAHALASGLLGMGQSGRTPSFATMQAARPQ